MALGSRRFHCRSSSPFAREDARDEILEPRITAQRVETMINEYPAQISRVEGRLIFVSLLHEAYGLVFLAASRSNHDHRLSRNMLLSCQSFQVLPDLLR